MNWEIVLFDFDGVILDSVDVKTKAFEEMYRPFGKSVASAVVDYHLAYGGISRFEKFRYFQENILGEPVSNQEIERLAAEFSRRVFKKVLAAPFIPGAVETLETIFRSKTPAFVVSGTPQHELREIVRHRELNRYFQDVFGSPRSKSEIISEILVTHPTDRDHVLMVGDAMTDYIAACETNIHFLGIIGAGHANPFPPGTPISTRVTCQIPMGTTKQSG